jgi:hypothetical protein
MCFPLPLLALALALASPRAPLPWSCVLYVGLKGPLEKKKKKRKSRSVVFAWDCVFLAYFVKTCCTSF